MFKDADGDVLNYQAFLINNTSNDSNSSEIVKQEL
jgi:hypothetical protein